MKIAVIGAGIAGLASAHLLSRRHSVVLFEKDGSPGGQLPTFVTQEGQSVDTGFMAFSEKSCPNLSGLFRELDVPLQKTQLTYSVSLNNGACEWAVGGKLRAAFAQPSMLYQPAHLRMLLEIRRLNAECRRWLASGQLPGGTLQKFLDDGGHSAALRSRYLLPIAGKIWSCSPRQAAEYPAADFIRFFDAQGLFTASRQPQWSSVKNGSRTYVKKILASFKGELRLNAAVVQLRRVDGKVLVSTEKNAELFDQVVCTVHSDQALRMLVDASVQEREVLGGIPYTQTHLILHTDESFLPRRRAAWASWNYTHERDEIHDRPISGSYWMNPLQNIPGPVNYIVTLNPTREPERDKLLYETTCEQPKYTAASAEAQRRLPEIQGKNRIWWAGAWCGYGLHEDGVKSAVAVATALGCSPAWTGPATHPAPQNILSSPAVGKS